MNDIFLDENLDLMFENGDFAVNDTTFQNQRLLLLPAKGQWKEFPDCGVDAAKFVETWQSDNLAREIDEQFTNDGMKVSRILVEIPDISVDARYENRS